MSATFPSGVIGHIVSMTRDYSSSARSVATCECGWNSSVPINAWRKQDQEIDAHWQEVVSKGAKPR